MSISNEAIIAIANAITANSAALQSLIEVLPHDAKVKVAAATQAANPTPSLAPAPAPITTVAQVATPAAIAPAATQMPAPPTFVTVPALAPVVTSVPFADGKGLLDWVMQSYKNMGAAKGAGIQTVLTGLGYANINDIKPEHYAALYAGIEALKA